MANPDPKDIESLVELFNQSDWDEMHLKTDDLEIYLSNDPNASGPQRATTAVSDAEPATAEPTPAAVQTQPVESAVSSKTTVPDGMAGVTAPNLGTFYRAPKPGAVPYVEVGQSVDADTEVCLIEVMKLFTPVRAGTAGVVKQICIEDAQMVEFGDVLVIIDPA